MEMLRKAYEMVLKEDWENLYPELGNKVNILIPMTVNNDTALHLAVCSGKEEPTRTLLAAISEMDDEEFYNGLQEEIEKKNPTDTGLLHKVRNGCDRKTFWKNNSENTPLHEAAFVGNLAAFKLLVEFKIEDLLEKNFSGETPLYRAARCGHLAIVAYILDECEDIYSRNNDNWRDRGEVPIIHAAIQNEKFDVVMKLLDFNPSLLEMTVDEKTVEEKTAHKKTALHLLATMPVAFYSGFSLTFTESIVYSLLPDDDIHNFNFKSLTNQRSEDLEIEYKPNTRPHKFRYSYWGQYLLQRLTFMFWRFVFWRFIMQGWPRVEYLYKKKRQCKLAMIIGEKLAKIDVSWRRSKQKAENNQINRDGKQPGKKGPSRDSLTNEGKSDDKDDKPPGKKGPAKDPKKSVEKAENTEPKTAEQTNDDTVAPDDAALGDIPIFNEPPLGPTLKDSEKERTSTEVKYGDCNETPLLLATANGIIELVEKIVEAHPQAVDYLTDRERNILHVAIAHRQEHILDWILKKRLVARRLFSRIDEMGFTALHHAGVIIGTNGRGKDHGPALHLQQELQWFERVRQEIPPQYALGRDYSMQVTAREYFELNQSETLKDAKEWLKKTSESCSAVAVLIATVVFAAAYTVPGGLNDKTGSPILLTQPIYMVFTVMDIVALATSLTSVVLFLSILTSSFKIDEFLNALPLKLSMGFQLLFVSVATTMMAFALTVVLTVRSEQKKWTVTLLYTATFFPVSMFIIIQLPLYVELLRNVWRYRHSLLGFVPTGFITPLWNIPRFLKKKSL